MDNPKFTKYKDTAQQYRFNLKAENGEIILHSEGYVSSAGCDNGISSVRKNSQYDSQYKRLVARNGEYYFNLTASNGQVIGTSETYTTVSARENGINAVKRVAPSASVYDIT